MFKIDNKSSVNCSLDEKEEKRINPSRQFFRNLLRRGSVKVVVEVVHVDISFVFHIIIVIDADAVATVETPRQLIVAERCEVFAVETVVEV